MFAHNPQCFADTAVLLPCATAPAHLVIAWPHVILPSPIISHPARAGGAVTVLLPFLIALAPILVVIVLLLRRVPAAWAALAALAVAVLGTWLAFPLSAQPSAEVAATMGPTTVTVVFILLGGVALAEITGRSGAQDVIAWWLRNTVRENDQLTTLLLVVFGVTPFMESVTGFGLGVVITAPLLVGLGLKPVKAVVTGMLGLVLVPWGSLGPGTLIASELGQVDFTGIGVWSALLSLPVLLINAALVIGLNHGRPRAREAGVALMLLLGQWAVLILSNLLFGPPAAGVLASLAVILLALGRLRAGGPLPPAPVGFAGALLPYAVLVAGLLGATVVLAVTGWESRLPANPGLWLNLAVIITLLLQRWSWSKLRPMLRSIWRRWQSVALVTLLYLALGTLMSANGMTAQLASTAASLGGPFVMLVPLIGALGGYFTGSNTGAAAMFSSATATAAHQLGLNALVVLSAQNVAGSVAIIASPPRMAFAAAVVLEPGGRLPARTHGTLLGAVGGSVVLLAVAMPWLSILEPGFPR